MSENYPRDLVGYGAQPPHPQWPGGARIAVQFVINYEEGGENCILHGDDASEAFLSDIVGAEPWPGQRHMSMESMYEYGSRAGAWRLLRLFQERNMTATCFCVGMALERHPEPVRAMRDAGFEIASHGYRWIDYRHVDEATERQHIAQSVAARVGEVEAVDRSGGRAADRRRGRRRGRRRERLDRDRRDRDVAHAEPAAAREAEDVRLERGATVAGDERHHVRVHALNVVGDERARNRHFRRDA